MFEQDKDYDVRKKLRDALKSSNSLGDVKFTIPAAAGRPEKNVTQTLKAARLTFKKRDTSKKKSSPKVKMNAVMAIEENPPEGQEALVWVFLTTLPIDTFEQVALIIRYYLARWEIEIFFKVLKSGCKVEDRRFKECESLLSLIAVFLIIAWRIMYVLKLGRESPEISCDVIFSEAEWKSVDKITHKKSELALAPPNLGKCSRMIAMLGGYLNRKNDPPPGPLLMWKGMLRMNDFALAWEVFL